MWLGVFPEYISIWICRLCRDHSHLCGWTSSHLLRDWIEQKDGGRVKLTFSSGPGAAFCCPWTLNLVGFEPSLLNWGSHHCLPQAVSLSPSFIVLFFVIFYIIENFHNVGKRNINLLYLTFSKSCSFSVHTFKIV